MLALVLFPAFAQEDTLGEPALFLRANDRFGLKLLDAVHQGTADRNIVISPLPVSLSFAALLQGSDDQMTVEEIHSALTWKSGEALTIAARMLHARFAKPKPVRAVPLPPPRPGMAPGFLDYLKYVSSFKPEELWLSGAILYRGQGSLAQDFIDQVRDNFGFAFQVVGRKTPQSRILDKNWDPDIPMPTVRGHHDVWVTSFTHLRTGWEGNTFVESKAVRHGFTLQSGSVVQADFLKSEMFRYPYVQTEDFEAVRLSCRQASILLIVPAPGKDIRQLETALAKDPEGVEGLLREQMGDVDLPPFHFAYGANLQAAIERMGVHRVFHVSAALLRAVSGIGAILDGILQRTEIVVDQNGIRADAGTVFAGIYGGVMAPQAPFHTVLNRPFLFLIRDNVTRALLFVGVVMDPTAS
jgi:serine protease inhibitor